MLRDETLDKIYEKMKDLSDDDIFGKERSLDKKTFDKVISELIKHKELDSEDIGYHVEEYLITPTELLEVYNYINQLAIHKEYESFYRNDGFTEQVWLVEYKHILFAVREICGQGTIIQFDIDYAKEFVDKIDILKIDSIDKEVKFRMK